MDTDTPDGGSPTRTVLVVEDEYLVGREIVEMLKRNGFRPLAIAPDGEAAVRMTDELEPDLVVMDIRMPKMDGITAAKMIQETCPTPVVILTADDSDEVVRDACEAGVSAFLTKPPFEKALKRALAIALARHADLMKSRRMNEELQQALEEIETLRGILPICAWCKKIRNDDGFWEQVELYFQRSSKLEFSHGICPHCLEKEMKHITGGDARGPETS